MSIPYDYTLCSTTVSVSGMRLDIWALLHTPGLLMVATVWILVHGGILLGLSFLCRSPFFFMVCPTPHVTPHCCAVLHCFGAGVCKKPGYSRGLASALRWPSSRVAHAHRRGLRPQALGSQANIGGAASAPLVAAAFNPALAPIGVLLAVLGYSIGTICAYITGLGFKAVAHWLGVDHSLVALTATTL